MSLGKLVVVVIVLGGIAWLIKRKPPEDQQSFADNNSGVSPINNQFFQVPNQPPPQHPLYPVNNKLGRMITHFYLGF